MDTTIKLKAIETRYNGYLFRSRLEARWAVFFDTLGIEYRYEPEGFDLNGIWYLPDFFLVKQQCWLEIKPDIPTDEEREKAIRLCLATRQFVALFGSDVWFDKKKTRYGFIPCAGVTKKDMEAHYAQANPTDPAIKSPHTKLQWITQTQCIATDGRHAPYGYDLARGYGWSTAYLVRCSCGEVGIEIPIGLYPCPTTCGGAMSPDPKNGILKEAYTAARQARF